MIERKIIMTCGIYKIENLVNHKIYIGQSTDIEKRWVKHKSSSQNQLDHSYNTPLYRSFRKYGISQFSFSVIEECKVSELNNRERYWINYYDSFFNGYNLTLGGDGSGTEIKKDKIIGIFQDLSTTNLLQREIAEKWNISEEMVQGINTGRYWKRDNINYPIRESKRQTQHYCIDCGKPIYKTSIRCIDCEKKHRIIPQEKMLIDRETLKSLIRITSFTQIGRQYGVADNTVRKWCDKFNLPKRVKDIKKYSDEDWKKI